MGQPNMGKRFYKLDRTKNRPLPTKEMSLNEGYLVCIFCFLLGFLLYKLNFYSFILVYPPLFLMFSNTIEKNHSMVCSSWLSGAIPPMLEPLHTQIHLIAQAFFFCVIYLVIPSFLAIAWVVYDDYKVDFYYQNQARQKIQLFLTMFYSLARIF